MKMFIIDKDNQTILYNQEWNEYDKETRKAQKLLNTLHKSNVFRDNILIIFKENDEEVKKFLDFLKKGTN